MPEEELLCALRAGSELALQTAMQTYGAYVYAIVQNRGAGQLTGPDLEELTADVFVRLWQNRARIQGSLKAWLGAVARNRVTDELRRGRSLLSLEEQTLAVDESVWDGLAQARRRELVRSALAQLDEQDREIFYRTYDLCQSSAQVAHQMGLNAATVRTRLRRGRQTIRAWLEEGGIQHADDL